MQMETADKSSKAEKIAMAVFSNIDLKAWREENKMSAADLAERISVDTSTIYKYEAGKLKPNPDVMFEICATLGDIGKWGTWMRTEYPASYARVHPETMQYDLKGALMVMFGQIQRLIESQTDVLLDGADGRIDSPTTAENLKAEVMELLRSVQRVSNLIQ